jgi:hypothetical protein
MLCHRAMRAADQACWQEQCQITTFGLVQQAGRQTAAQRVQLDLGDRAFQA